MKRIRVYSNKKRKIESILKKLKTKIVLNRILHILINSIQKTFFHLIKNLLKT